VARTNVDDRRALIALARAWGVQTAYRDGTGRRRVASRESVLATLRLLGAPVETPADVSGALREHELTYWRRLVDPVVAAWEEQEAVVPIRLPRRGLPARVAGRLRFENGDTRHLQARTGELPVLREAEIDGERFVEVALPLGASRPRGYHRLEVNAGRLSGAGVVIAAPRRAYRERSRTAPDWGVFLPLYALHGERSWGAGCYADLARLVDWTAGLGGRDVGTLPLLPTFLDRPYEPSPYMPASRLMWSELHLAVENLPELARSAEASALVRSRRFRRRLARLREAGEVDHREQSALQRPVLERLAEALSSRRLGAFRKFLRAHPEVGRYARFRATTERFGRPWQDWPARLRCRRLHRKDCDPSAERYHAFCQWLAAEQIGAVADRALARDARLCLDLPLGVHPAGFDVWRRHELFASGASAGAPPDAFFTGGQNWCLPPIRPERSRAEAHDYFAACLRHHMEPAGVLRIDHVMSLHRLFWVPDGHGPADGVYVHYPAEELYAVLCLESWRNRCIVVGEDLGTVPREVRPAMRRHGLLRTCVLRFERGSNPRRPLESMRIDGVAALRTHDMAAFAAFWRGLDIGRRKKLGHLSADDARGERATRRRLKAAWLRDLRRAGLLRTGEAKTADVFRACLALLAASDAETVLVDLEDVWGETRPHNVPGTTDEYPNWRRKARYPLDVFETMPGVLRVLRDLNRRRAARRGGRGAV
jgi:4-alpha-glucanotransferase